MQSQSINLEQYLSVKNVAQMLDVSRATIWRLTASGQFPAPIKLSPGCTRWKLSDVENFCEEHLNINISQQ